MGQLLNRQQVNTVLLALCLLLSNCVQAQPLVSKGLQSPDFQVSHASTGIVSDKSDVKIKISADTDQDDAIPMVMLAYPYVQQQQIGSVAQTRSLLCQPHYVSHARAPPIHLV